MFHPARPRVYLFMFFLVRTDDLAAIAKNDKPGTGRALI
jgi:hypothetical protein